MILPNDPRFRAARIWSNQELRKFAPKLRGSMVNVSGWRDSDKEGGTYQANYFTNASEYWITNWKAEARGLQGDLPNEFFLDLEQDLPDELHGKFDVVFNHTTLEHVFDVFKAFENLCDLSSDVIIVVVPFLQEQHGAYGDYWRFTPWAVKRLFQRFGVTPAYINFNDGKRDAIYLVAVGARQPSSIKLFEQIDGNCVELVEQTFIGTKILDRQSWIIRLLIRIINRII